MSRNLGRVNSICSRRGDRAMGKIVQAFCQSRLISDRRLLSNKGPPGWLDGDNSGSCQCVIGMPDCIKIDFESNGDLSHRGHLITGLKDACAESPKHLVSDLHIDWNTGLLDAQSV